MKKLCLFLASIVVLNFFVPAANAMEEKPKSVSELRKQFEQKLTIKDNKNIKQETVQKKETVKKVEQITVKPVTKTESPKIPSSKPIIKREPPKIPTSKPFKTGQEIGKKGIRKPGEYTTFYDVENKENNTLDLIILLDENYEEFIIEKNLFAKKVGEIEHIAITSNFSKAIDGKEAIFATTSLLRGFYNLVKNKTSFLNPLQIRVLNDVFNKLFSDRWSVFLTKDGEFVLLIPHLKYPGIKKLEDLKTIGLNPEILYEIKNYDQVPSSENLSSRVYDIVNFESILNIFSKEQVVDLRVYLNGHGREEFEKEVIASLSRKQYSELRDKLNNSGCSFLFVQSCYGGGNVYDMQTFNVQRTKLEDIGIKELSSKKFIEVAAGIPASQTSSNNIAVSDLFIIQSNMSPEERKRENTKIGSYDHIFNLFFGNVNSFFEEAKNITKKFIESDKNKQKYKGKTSDFIVENSTEQQILIGNTEYGVPPIRVIEKTELRKLPVFSRIFREFLRPDAKNIPRVRFPGDKEMLPLKEAFTKLVPQAIEILKQTLKDKSELLKKKKENIAQDEKKGTINPEFIKAYKNEAKKLEREIYDIARYIKQLS